MQKNFVIFFFLSSLITLSILIGSFRLRNPVQNLHHNKESGSVPHIGRIIILNGCGISGAATAVAGFLRDRKFDVKNTGDAATWNYESTIVVSKTRDMTVARQVAAVLSTDNIILMREKDETYDVAVILGPDFGENINR